MTSINEAFTTNMIGKPMDFDVQPYKSGTGTIKAMTPRRVRVKEFSAERGTTFAEYEVFDIVVECEDGRETGALICGVPVASTVKGLAGREVYLTGVRYGDIYKGKFTSATCG